MSNADAVIAALRTGYDSLADLVLKFSDDDLAAPSAASEWDRSQVLSHLGSGAEIMLATVQSALDGGSNPGREFNVSVWDRWNAMSRRERADGFLDAGQAVTQRFESLDSETRESLRIDVGFMPAPVDVATAGRLRLSELTLHSWDVRVSVDEHATLAPEATVILLPRSGDLLGWTGKSDPLGGAYTVIEVTTSEPESVFTLHLNSSISMASGAPEQPDGTLALPAEAWLRLVAGRLSAARTPSTVATTGAADLDLLRQVFPGY